MFMSDIFCASFFAHDLAKAPIETLYFDGPGERTGLRSRDSVRASYCA
jgi:hypothetical protein